MSDKNGYLFLDLETTGLKPSHDLIFEVAWVLTDLKLNYIKHYQRYIAIDEWHGLGYQERGKTLLPEPQKYHARRIWNSTAPEKKASLKQVMAYTNEEIFFNHGFKKVTLAGFNPSFDAAFLEWVHYSWEKPYPFDYRKLDIESAALAHAKMMGGLDGGDLLRSRMLSFQEMTMMEAFGQAHSALYDAFTSYAIALKIADLPISFDVLI